MRKTFRTRIILLFIFLTVGSGILINLIVWKILDKRWTQQAVEKAYQEYYRMESEIERKLEKDSINLDTFFSYIFKVRGSDYEICIDTEKREFIYNPTILTMEMLEQYTYNQLDNENAEQVQVTINNGRYCITRGILRGYQIYQIQSIDYVRRDIWNLIKVLMVVSIFVTVVSGIGFSIFLYRHFQPLEELNLRVNAIAEGDYESVIEVRKNDEIGNLAESVNKMSKTILQRSERIQREQENKTRFMGSFAHELKTPMTVISGYAQTLLSVELADHDRQTALKYIISESIRIEKLSKALMQLFELEQGKSIEMKWISIDEIFNQTMNICKPLLQEKEINIITISKGEKYYVNEELFVDAMVNLLENAIKVSDIKGKIKLMAEGKNVSVTDYGTRIPEEKIEHLTEAFYMVDKSRSRKNGGSGLGLTLVNTIVTRMNARLTIHQSEECGKTFFITFDASN